MIDSEIVVGTGLRITVAKDELAAKLAIVARGVSTRATVLVLGGIQLRAESGQLHFAATDMEVSLRATVDAQVSDEGVVVVPGRLLLDIARSLPDSDVSIEHKPEEAVVVVTAGTAARSESSMSVAARRSSSPWASSRIPDRIWIAVRLETARPTSVRPCTSSSFAQVILSSAPTAMSLSII